MIKSPGRDEGLGYKTPAGGLTQPCLLHPSCPPSSPSSSLCWPWLRTPPPAAVSRCSSSVSGNIQQKITGRVQSLNRADRLSSGPFQCFATERRAEPNEATSSAMADVDVMTCKNPTGVVGTASPYRLFTVGRTANTQRHLCLGRFVCFLDV